MVCANRFISVDDKREESGMRKRLLIGLMAVVFVLIGIHLSWGGLSQECPRPTFNSSPSLPGR